jgi:hypothetical protein
VEQRCMLEVPREGPVVVGSVSSMDSVGRVLRYRSIQYVPGPGFLKWKCYASYTRLAALKSATPLQEGGVPPPAVND